MGVSVITSNQSLKVSSRINVTGSTSASNSVLYTVPSNSYAVVNVFFDTTFAGGEYALVVGSAGPTSCVRLLSRSVSTDPNSTLTIYLGPGETIKTLAAGNSMTYAINGVAFINSP